MIFGPSTFFADGNGMSFDIYQPCPGGQDKKIKFCCKDLVSDLEKISRLIDADQRQAALDYIGRTLKKHPDRPCLHAYKLQLAIGDPDREEVIRTIDAFLKVAPANPTALAAQAIRYAADWDAEDSETVGSSESWRKAVAALQRALSARGKYVSVLILSAVSIVGRRLLGEGQDLAAAAHFHLAALFASNLERTAPDIIEFMADPGVSLLIKNRLGLPDPPADVPWNADYNGARVKAANGAWADAASAIEGLAKDALGEPLPRKALGLLRGYLGESQKSVDLLRRYAAMDGVSSADAIEAEALAQLLHSDSNRQIKSYEIRCEVDDTDQTKEKLLAHKQAVSLGTDLSHLADGDEPPPLAGFWVVDREPPGDVAELTWGSVPRELGVVYLFGKQTDRAARLEIFVEEQELDRLRGLLADILGTGVLDDSETEVVEEYPAENTLIQETLAFPHGTPLPIRKKIEAEAYRGALRERWTDTPLGILDGKTPREAAQEDGLRVRLQAALLVLEAQQFAGLSHADYQALREELGIPQDGMIVCRPGMIRSVPLFALVRVDCTRLNDADLSAGFQYALANAAVEAATNFGQEILRRPATPLEVKANVNIGLFRLAGDPNDALAYLHEAQRHVKELGHSPAQLLIQELALRAMRRESQEFNAIYERIAKRHINEPGVREQLLDVMVRLGLLRPDGTPVTESAAPTPVSGAPAAAETAELWTPDSAAESPAAGAEEAKSKLWVPGMD
jgi:hypothetical protein